MADQKVVFTVDEGGTDGNSWRLESRKIAGDGSNCDIWVSPKGRTAHVCVSTSDTTGVEVRSIAWRGGVGHAACEAYQDQLVEAHTPKVEVPEGAPENWAEMSKKQRKEWTKEQEKTVVPE